MPRLRALHQGAPGQQHRFGDDGTVADLGARLGRRAAGPQDLSTDRRLVGAILAGGANRRFGGEPKGLEVVGGARVIDRVRSALAPVSDEIVLIANDPDAANWLAGARVLRDVHAGAGGLAGVHAAISTGADVLAVAWDMPFVTRELLEAIRAHARTSGAEVCLPESPSPHGIEPFCALYRHTVAARLETFLESGGGPARDFLARCIVHRLSPDEVSRFGDPATLFLSVNTPADLARARSREKV